jgi:hypothetical protein
MMLICDVCGSRYAAVRAWVISSVRFGKVLAEKMYLCEECRGKASMRGDLVPGAEIEVL